MAEALFESEEGRLKPAVADGGEDDRYGEGRGVAEEVASEAGVLVLDSVVAGHESDDVEDVESV